MSDQAQAGESDKTADGTEQQPVGGEQAPASDNQTTTTPPEAEKQPVAGVDDYERRLREATTVSDEPKQGEEPAKETTEETEEAPAEADEKAEEPEKTEETEDKIPERIRLKGLSDKSRAKLAAATMLAKAEGIEFDEAYARLNPPPAEKPAEPAKPDDNAPRTIEAVDADIKAQRQAKREAIRAMDPDAQFAAEDRIEELDAEKAQILETENRKVAEAQTDFERQVDESQAEAARYYPAVKEKDHAIHAEADRIWSLMEKSRNPLITQANAPLAVYQMAANALGIAPVDPEKPSPKSPTSATPKPQTVSHTAVRRPTPAVSPAPGSGRTTPPGPTSNGIGKIRTVADYERRVAELAGA